MSPRDQVVRKQSGGSSHQKRTCLCSPTTHPGSFRCSIHKNASTGAGFGGAYQSNRLNARRSAMTNSLVTIGRSSCRSSLSRTLMHASWIPPAAIVRLQQTEKSSEASSLAISLTTAISTSLDLHSTSSRRLSQVRRSSSANSNSPSRPPGDDAAPAEQDFPTPSFRRMLAMSLPEWKQASMGCLSAILFGAVHPVYAFTMGSMVSVYFLPEHDEIKTKTQTYSFWFDGLAVFSLLVNISQHYNFAATGEYLTERLKERMFSKILTFEVGWFDQDQNSTGAICTRLTKDANMVRSLVGDRMALVVQTFSVVIIACTMGLVIACRLVVVMTAVQPLIIVCYYTRRLLLKSMSAKAIKAQEESSKFAAEAVSNFRTITAFSSQTRILR